MNGICLKLTEYAYVVVEGLYLPLTAFVMLRLGLHLESNPNDRRSLGSNPQPLVYKNTSFTTRTGGFSVLDGIV